MWSLKLLLTYVIIKKSQYNTKSCHFNQHSIRLLLKIIVRVLPQNTRQFPISLSSTEVYRTTKTEEEDTKIAPPFKSIESIADESMWKKRKQDGARGYTGDRWFDGSIIAPASTIGKQFISSNTPQTLFAAANIYQSASQNIWYVEVLFNRF